jgi:hypothetical protein
MLRRFAPGKPNGNPRAENILSGESLAMPVLRDVRCRAPGRWRIEVNLFVMHNRARSAVRMAFKMQAFMKTTLLFGLITAACIGAAHAADYAIFKICQDQRIIRTSDGAEAGHIEYIVVDPSSREIVSTVVSGGVEGDRLLAVPYSSLTFSGGNEITLREVTRERLVSAPVIERTQINAAVIAPDIIERTREHFGARGEVRGEVNVPGREGRAGAGERVAPESRNAGVNGTSRTESPNAAAGENRNSTQSPRATSQSSAENPNARSEEGNRPPNRKNANAESPNGTANGNEAQPNRGKNFPSTNSRNEEGPSAEGGNKTPRNANSRENTPAERAINGAKPGDEPASKAAAERAKPQNEKRGAAAEENKAAGERPAQGSRPEAGARSLDEAPASSPSSRAKKAGEENPEGNAPKNTSKKSPSAGEEKGKRSDEQRPPQF